MGAYPPSRIHVPPFGKIISYSFTHTVQSLGREDLLEGEMAAHSSILEKSHGQMSLVDYSL